MYSIVMYTPTKVKKLDSMVPEYPIRAAYLSESKLNVNSAEGNSGVCNSDKIYQKNSKKDVTKKT